ncbi:MAG: FkbM family methyltransferase [Xanthobacteraceae bacterium]|nr:FkbM family methyltransferase [Xanthobacteraceae bacterium]
MHRINAGPAAGLRFEVMLPRDKAIWSGTYECDFAEVLAGATRPGAVCYDVGGYRGYMAGVMAAAGASKVIVLEPLPENEQAIRRFCALNPALPIEILGLAAGKANGVARFRTMPDASMAKLTTSPFQPHAEPLGEIEVRLRTIDALVREGAIPPPDLVKIDVEGAECDVLAGAAETLPRWKPAVLLEAHSTLLEQDCARTLRDLGYCVRRIGQAPRSMDHTRHLLAVADREAGHWNGSYPAPCAT